MSEIYAAVPVGLIPVEKPCTKRKIKNGITVVAKGYKKPQAKHTSEPNAITGTRPTLSVSFPLNGLERPAVSVNKEIISPLNSPPPIFDKYSGSSGISILKLEKNRKELTQRSQNWRVKMLLFFKIYDQKLSSSFTIAL
jgi:hypothetical protein